MDDRPYRAALPKIRDHEKAQLASPKPPKPGDSTTLKHLQKPRPEPGPLFTPKLHSGQIFTPDTFATD